MCVCTKRAAPMCRAALVAIKRRGLFIHLAFYVALGFVSFVLDVVCLVFHSIDGVLRSIFGLLGYFFGFVFCVTSCCFDFSLCVIGFGFDIIW